MVKNTSYGVIWKILNTLDLALDLDELPENEITPERFNISQNRLNNYLVMLQNAGYIDGIQERRFIGDKKPTLDISNIRITLDGIQFLIENSTMNKIASAAKEVGMIVAEGGISALTNMI